MLIPSISNKYSPSYVSFWLGSGYAKRANSLKKMIMACVCMYQIYKAGITRDLS